MTPTPNQLWNLGGALFDLLEAREEAQREAGRLAALRYESGNDIGPEAWQAAEAELAAIEHGITQFVAQQLRDVDGLRAPLKALEQGVAINKADAAAATNRAMVLQNRYDKLKDLIRSCMIALDQAGEWKPKESRKFESARGSFLLRGNGGAAPVEVYDADLVPDYLCTMTVTLLVSEWNRRTNINVIREGPREPSKSLIALELDKPCGNCDGSGKHVCLHIIAHENDMNCPDCDDDGYDGTCSECGGTGKQGVPGARLGERGVSVVIK